MKLESKVQKEILDEAARRGFYARKIVTANKAGVPDILMCVLGMFYMFEVKRKEGMEPSPLQQANIDQIKRAGGRAYTVGSLRQFKLIVEDITAN